MDLQTGDEYPCGNNDPGNTATGKAKCYLFHGSNANLGTPTSIMFTDFKYPTGIIKVRFIMKNPIDPNVWVTMVVKAYKTSFGG